MRAGLRTLAGGLLAVTGCFLLHRALYGFLSALFGASPVPWARVAGSLLFFGAAIWGARELWERWLLAFGTTAIVVGIFTYRIYVKVQTTKELATWNVELWAHRELLSRKLLIAVFLTLGVVTYYYDYVRHYRRPSRPES